MKLKSLKNGWKNKEFRGLRLGKCLNLIGLERTYDELKQCNIVFFDFFYQSGKNI